MKKSYFFKNKVKSIICFAVFSMFLFVSSCYAQMYYYYPTGGGTITSSGGNVFNVGTGTQLTVNVPMCITGNTNPKNATNFNLSWYVNTVNSNTGGTFVSGGTQSTGTNFNALYSLAISNSTPGVYYYYAVSNGGNASVCSGTNSMTSSVFQVTVNGPATHLNFDGTNDNVMIPDNSSLDFTTAYTVEAMVKLNRTTGFHQTIVSKYEDDTNKRSWMINFGEHGTGRLSVVMTSAGTWTNPLSWNTGFLPTIGTWYHIAVVFDSSLPSNQVKLYVDGALYAQTTWNYTLTPTDANVYVGGYDGFNNGFNTGANSRFLQGNIEELRMWNVARTPEQINGSRNCELAGPESGLVAYYNFNQGNDAGNNSTVTTLTAMTGPSGTLTNFALAGATSNWLAGSPVTTGSFVPAVATVTTPVVRNQGDTAPTLTATIGANGTGLLWYTTATGGTGSATAPTLSTATVGSTSYWVSSTNANGCESARVEIVFTVNALVSATHLNFDGINDHVTIPATAINNLPQGTIETWVYLNSLNQQTICAKQSNGEASYAIFAVGGGGYDQGAPIAGQVSYQSKNGSIIKSTGPLLQTGQWYHLAITFTNTQARLYINGVLNNTVNADFSIPNDVTVTATTIGAWLGSGGGQYFNGNIDEFRVWNVALSATDIANTMNCEAMSQPELVTYYKFNQGYDGVSNTGITSLTDSAGSNNGTLTNFALSGATSNWKSGSTVATGNTCTTLEAETFNTLSEVVVYPNPSTGILNIAIQEDANITVNDMLGKVIYTNKVKAGNNTIDISNYQSGIYLLSVTTENGSVTKKLIKE